MKKLARLLLPVLLLTATLAAEELTEAVRTRIERNRPPNVSVSSIDFEKSVITLRGQSDIPAAIANFVSNIHSDPLFSDVDLKYIRETGKPSQKKYEYEFSFAFHEE